MENTKIKEVIKQSYGEIAKRETVNGSCCGLDDSAVMAEDYSQLDGYEKDADLGLGCGLPTEIANIKTGDTVIDLGSGAGNDVFIARRIVGETGRVIGVDMTPEMIVRALQNNQKLGYQNVEFHLTEIENMNVVKNETADVVVSNCVMNLVPDKKKAFAEVNRVLKEGGHFSISDIVYVGSMPDRILEAAEMHAGCVAGASEKSKYLGIIKEAGFKNIQIKKERRINLSDDLLLQYVNDSELADYKTSGSGIYSITVYADKSEDGNCCESTESSCCGSEKTSVAKATSCCS